MIYYDKLRGVFTDGAGYARTNDILAAGIHFAHVKKLMQEGIVTQIRRGHYRWDELAVKTNGLYEASRLIPKGVFCLYSAAEFHGLTTYQPWQYHIAIERSAKVTGIDENQIKIYYWSKSLLEWGIAKVHDESGSMPMTNVERTVCDLVKYRHKTGKDTMLEVIRTYMTRKDRDISLLLQYARQLRVETIIKPYLEASL
jgi:predicted transcriptional regulator of viral defense system